MRVQMPVVFVGLSKERDMCLCFVLESGYSFLRVDRTWQSDADHSLLIYPFFMSALLYEHILDYGHLDGPFNF